MNFLDFIPEYIFETIGFIAGIFACFVIAIQIFKEYKSQEQSSLSYGYIIGWGIIFIFWGLYGLRFDAKALWLTNGVGTVLQVLLLLVVLKKRRARKVN